MNSSRNLSTILSLPANVSQTEAFREFQSTRLPSLVWRLGNGPLQRIAPLYLPVALYRLRYQLGRVSRTRYFAIDQVEGSLDLFEFSHALADTDLHTIETQNKIAPALSCGGTETLLREKGLRLIFQQGFFRLSRLRLELDCVISQFHIPYWLGFYGRDGGLRCRALDAVRRRMEGPKATLLFERWLAN